MQTKLAHVKLIEIIVSETNEMFRDPSELNQESLQELIDSVKEKGVIQPVLLRPLPNGYQLICGERRFRASGFAGLDTIPANIREMTDEEAFECQVTENLQRKDVHPLKEAKAYKFMMDKDSKNTAPELALRFGKTEHYILTRLKLNDLIPDGKKDYQSGKMTLGHALLIARLTPEDQKETIKSCGGRYYESIQELEDHIESSVMCNLSKAAFKKDDLTLVPKAGPCTTCQFRTGANQLFADIKEKDRCMKPACFEQKKAAFMAIQVREIIEEKPDTVFLLEAREKVNPELTKALKEFNIKPLVEYTDFNTYSYSGNKKIKGFYLNGTDAGTYKTVYSSKEKETKTDKAKSSGSTTTLTAAEKKSMIAGIQERAKRAAELDQEKVYVKVVDALKKSDVFTKVTDTKWNKTDEMMATFMILEHHEFGLRDKLRRMFKLPNDYGPSSEKFIEALGKLTNKEIVAIVRITMLEHFAGQATNIHSVEGKLLTLAARQYGGVDVDKFEREQDEERKKREARAKERIAALKSESKPKKKSDKKKEPVEA